MSDRIPTLADVCSAIAEGRLAVASDGSVYQVNALELRRYFNKHLALPALSFANLLSAPYSDGSEWSASHYCRIGH